MRRFPRCSCSFCPSCRAGSCSVSTLAGPPPIALHAHPPRAQLVRPSPAAPRPPGVPLSRHRPRVAAALHPRHRESRGQLRPRELRRHAWAGRDEGVGGAQSRNRSPSDVGRRLTAARFAHRACRCTSASGCRRSTTAASRPSCSKPSGSRSCSRWAACSLSRVALQSRSHCIGGAR